MKLKKVIVAIVILIIMININSICSAKYVFDYTIVAAEVKIENNQTESE